MPLDWVRRAQPRSTPSSTSSVVGEGVCFPFEARERDELIRDLAHEERDRIERVELDLARAVGL